MDGGVGPSGDNVVHEVEEFDAPPPLLVSRRHLTGGHLEGGEKRLQCLDRGLSMQMTIAFSGGAM